jgi:hypothetical protein
MTDCIMTCGATISFCWDCFAEMLVVLLLHNVILIDLLLSQHLRLSHLHLHVDDLFDVTVTFLFQMLLHLFLGVVQSSDFLLQFAHLLL